MHIGPQVQEWSDCFRFFSPLAGFDWGDPRRDEDDANAAPLRTAWLQCWQLRDFAPFLLRRAGEGLDILALISRIDPLAWKTQVLKLWPTSQQRWFERQARLRIPFEVGVEMSIGSEGELAILSDRILDVNVLYEYYLDERESLEAAAATHTSSISSIPPWRPRPRIPVRIEIDAKDPSSGEVSMLLQQILQLVMAQRCLTMQETPSDGSDPMIKHRARFEIDGVGFSATTRPLLDEQDLRYLYKLTEYGVFVRDLPAFKIGAVHPMNETEARSLVHCLRSLLGFSGDKREVSQSSTGFGGVQSLTISKKTPRRYLNALLAGAQVSASLRTIRIQIKGMRGRRDMWRRIATSLFGRFATHNIVRLEVDLDDFRSVDVDAIVDELQDAKDDDDTRTSTASACVCFATSAEFYLFEPVEDDEDDELSSITFEPTVPVEVRVLESTADWGAKWMVQLPGWGDAWIKAPDKGDTRTFKSELLAGNSGNIHKPIPQVEISSMSTRSADAVLSLLEVIGCDVQYLEVAKYIGHDPIDSWSHAVLAMCPSLRDFKVASATSITNVDTFCDALATAPCRPTNVTFAPMRGIHYSTIRRVFERLGDATDPLASQLQGIVMQLEIHNEASLCVVRALKDMLQTNRRLLNVGFAVDVGFRYREAKARVKEILAPVVDDDDKNQVMIPTGPLALHRKLAFLSAVHTREPTTRSLQQLDSVVVAIIFAFAAPSRPRTVYVQYA